jgi:hypothetical protein
MIFLLLNFFILKRFQSKREANYILCTAPHKSIAWENFDRWIGWKRRRNVEKIVE